MLTFANLEHEKENRDHTISQIEVFEGDLPHDKLNDFLMSPLYQTYGAGKETHNNGFSVYLLRSVPNTLANREALRDLALHSAVVSVQGEPVQTLSDKRTPFALKAYWHAYDDKSITNDGIQHMLSRAFHDDFASHEAGMHGDYCGDAPEGMVAKLGALTLELRLWGDEPNHTDVLVDVFRPTENHFIYTDEKRKGKEIDPLVGTYTLGSVDDFTPQGGFNRLRQALKDIAKDIVLDYFKPRFREDNPCDLDLQATYAEDDNNLLLPVNAPNSRYCNSMQNHTLPAVERETATPESCLRTSLSDYYDAMLAKGEDFADINAQVMDMLTETYRARKQARQMEK